MSPQRGRLPVRSVSPAPGACGPALLRPPLPAASRPLSLTGELWGGGVGWSQAESPGDSAGRPCHLRSSRERARRCARHPLASAESRSLFRGQLLSPAWKLFRACRVPATPRRMIVSPGVGKRQCSQHTGRYPEPGPFHFAKQA